MDRMFWSVSVPWNANLGRGTPTNLARLENDVEGDCLGVLRIVEENYRHKKTPDHLLTYASTSVMQCRVMCSLCPGDVLFPQTKTVHPQTLQGIDMQESHSFDCHTILVRLSQY